MPNVIFKLNTTTGVCMAKNNRRLSMVYPEENEGKTKEANRKLKAQVKNLKKTVRQLESQVRTLNRSFDKSCDFIQHKLKNKGLKEILDMIDSFEYKETEYGRQKVREEKKKKEESSILQSCPRCNSDASNGFKIMSFADFKVETCPCGYRSRKDNGDEGNKGS